MKALLFLKLSLNEKFGLKLTEICQKNVQELEWKSQ